MLNIVVIASSTFLWWLHWISLLPCWSANPYQVLKSGQLLVAARSGVRTRAKRDLWGVIMLLTRYSRTPQKTLLQVAIHRVLSVSLWHCSSFFIHFLVFSYFDRIYRHNAYEWMILLYVVQAHPHPSCNTQQVVWILVGFWRYDLHKLVTHADNIACFSSTCRATCSVMWMDYDWWM